MSTFDSQFEFLKDEIRGSWRFRRVALVVAWAIAIPAWILVALLPDEYEARARVYVETTTELRPLLQGLAIDSDVQSQLDLVRQALLSQPTLQKIADSSGLSKGAVSPLQREQLLEELRKRIDLSVEAPRGSGNYLYSIAYRDGNRDRSVTVVKMLLDTFIEEVIGKKRSGQVDAQQFLQREIQAYEKRLSEAESRLADFKRRNLGLVPGERGDFFSRLQAETDLLERDRSALRVAELRRHELTQQLNGETAYVPMSSDSNTGNNGTRSLAASDTTARLQEAETRLQELLLRFTDKHPEVLALRETITELQARQAREFSALKSGNLADAGGQKAYMNPVYQNIQLSLNQLDVEIAALRGQLADRERRSAEMRQLAVTAPDVEAEFARLNRDYGVTRAQYQSMVERLERARLSDKADENGVVKFTIIDPPVAKLEPVAPKRGLLTIAALMFALIAGAATTYALHMFRPVFQNVRSLANVTGMRVLGAISMARPEAWRAAEFGRLRAFGISIALLLVTCGVMLTVGDTAVHFLRRLATGA